MLHEKIDELEARRETVRGIPVARFVNRRRGNPGHAARDSGIAEQIWADSKVEAAVKQVMKDYRLSRANVFRIWSEWKPILRRRHRVYGPLSHDDIRLYWPLR